MFEPRIHAFIALVALAVTPSTSPPSLQRLITTIATLTGEISLLAIAMAALAWAIGSALKGVPIPLREMKEWGHGFQIDAIKAIFLVAIYSALSSLVAWVAALLASA